VYEAHEEEEPPYQYVPDVAMDDRNAAIKLSGGDALAQSMFLLEDGLGSGALLAQFEQLYRKNPSMSMNEARRPENQSKNRYRDISPCKLKYVVIGALQWVCLKWSWPPQVCSRWEGRG